MWEQDEDFSDPNNPDFDLSEAGINYYVPDRKPWFLRRFFFLIVLLTLILVALLPLANLL
jgi:hypothetical protein